MDVLYENGLEVTRWLQENYAYLRSFMSAFSLLGTFEFYLALIPFVYWCVNKQFGKHLAYLLALTAVVNAIGKHALRTPRPFWLDGDLAIGEESRYGIPSGHVQLATTVYLFFAYWARRNWGWLLALLLIAIMALSRIYLGLHFPLDVIAGALVGTLVLAAYLAWLRYFYGSFRNRILGQRILWAVIIPLVFLAVYVVVRLIIGTPSADVAWAQHIPSAELASVEDIATNLGILLGLGIGFLLEAARIHFLVEETVVKRAARYVLGMVVTVAIWRGLALLFPEDPLWLALPLRFLRYALAGLWVTYYAPAVFVRVGLAEAAPEPDDKLTFTEGSIMRG